MEWLAEVWKWLMDGGLLAVVLALLAVSEVLALIPSIKSNSVFQWILNALKWIKEKAPKPKE